MDHWMHMDTVDSFVIVHYGCIADGHADAE